MVSEVEDTSIFKLAQYKQQGNGRSPELEYNGVSAVGNNVTLFARAQFLNSYFINDFVVHNRVITVHTPLIPVVKEPEIINLPTKNPDNLIEKPREFDLSAKALLEAIIKRKKVAGVDIVQKIQDPHFRFTSTIDPDLSASMSEAFAVLLSYGRSKAGKKGNVERNRKGDQFATKMHAMIQNMQSESGVTTLQATVDLLNQKGVKTYSEREGSKWHLKTLQDLQKRWKALGLIPEKPKL